MLLAIFGHTYFVCLMVNLLMHTNKYDLHERTTLPVLTAGGCEPLLTTSGAELYPDNDAYIASAYHSCSVFEPVDGSVDASVDGSQPVDVSHGPQFVADTLRLRHPTQSACLDAGLPTSLLTAENSNREFLAHAVFIDDSSDANDGPYRS